MSNRGYEYGGFNPMDGHYDGGYNFGGEAEAPSSASKDRKGSKDKQSITPLSIKMLQNATIENEAPSVDGRDLNNVIIVGNVESMEEGVITIYRVNDGTGSIDCKHFSSGGAGAETMGNIR